MPYEINISKNGKHYFATAERSLTTLGESTKLYNELKEFYPESQGFKLSLTKWETIGKEIKIDGTAELPN
jgi:hypothetical protein